MDLLKFQEIPPNVITLEWLWNHGACSVGTVRFERVFPHGMEVTRENVIKGFVNFLDFDWALLFLLTKQDRREFYQSINRASDRSRRLHILNEQVHFFRYGRYATIRASIEAAYRRVIAKKLCDFLDIH